MDRRASAIAALLLLLASSGFSLESVDFYGGLQWIGNPTYEPASSSGEPTGGPSPILNSYGIAFPLELGKYFRFVPELSLFGTQYGLIRGYEKTVPVEREYADAIWFLGALVDASFWLDIPLGSSLGLGFGLGGAFLGRIPITAWGDGWDQLDTMAGYFYGLGRYFYPVSGLFFTWHPSMLDRLGVSVRAKTYYPIFHYWDEEEVTFLDQFMVGVSIGLRLYPPAPKEEDTAEDSAP